MAAPLSKTALPFFAADDDEGLAPSRVALKSVIDGTDGDDTLNGTDESDIINGYAGRDILNGRGGDDSLYGGGGNDFLDGGAGNDWLNTDHDDRWWDDTLYGGAGDDVLNAGYGNDNLHGGDGDDILIAGHERLSPGDVPGDADGDRLYGDAGNDTLIGSGMSDSLYGGDGDDTLLGGTGQDQLYSDPGADTLDGGGGRSPDYADYRSSDAAVLIDLAAGTGQGGHAEGDTIRNIEIVRGSAYGDTLIGDDAANELYGFGGNDTLVGGGGADNLVGLDGDDILQGGAGDDRLEGRTGADQLDGGDGLDTMVLYSFEGVPGGVTVDLAAGTTSGGAIEPGDTFSNIEGVDATQYNDVLVGDANANSFTGREGADFIDGGAGSDTVQYIGEVRGPGGFPQEIGVRIDLATGQASDADATGDTLVGIENVVGSYFNDVLSGNGEDNHLSGRSGQDSLSGAGGNDVLIDPDGNDRMGGGAGADSFVFMYGNNTQSVIVDFSASDGDKIDLSTFYGSYDSEGPTDLAFMGYGEFTGGSGQLRLVSDGASTDVLIDANGDRAADFTIALTGVTETLDADAFIL